MAKLIVRAVRPGDVEVIASGMRQADRDEVLASVGHDNAVTVLLDGIASSRMVWTIEVGGAPAALFGVAHATEDVGVPWMLGTHDLERAPKQLCKLARRYVTLMLQRYATLLNYVDARNLKSVYWLASIGFTVQRDTEPFGPLGMPFHRFEARK